MSNALRYVFIALLVGVGIIEAIAYLSLQIMQGRGFAVSIPSAEEYKEYLAIRNPELGWPARSSFGAGETDSSGARRLPNYPDPSIPACVHAFGDSFTWGDEVDAEHSYPNVLAGLLECRVANFGVGGYGTDQAFLRYRLLERNYAPVVILGHYAEDITRNVNQYRAFLTGRGLGFKPRFVVDQSGSLQLIPLPKLTETEFRQLSSSSSELLPYEYFDPNKLGNSPFIEFPYSLALLRTLFHYRVEAIIAEQPSFEPFYYPEHPSNALNLTRLIVHQFIATARDRDQIPVFIIIPDRNDLDLVRRGEPATYTQLTHALSQDGINSPNIAKAMIEHLGTRPTCEIYASCTRNSHFNPEGYELLAAIVHHWLINDDEIVHQLTPAAQSRSLQYFRNDSPGKAGASEDK